MRQKLLLLAFFAFQFLNAQVINFPDVIFKDKLLQLRTNYDPNGVIIYPEIDANNDGEITQSEALLVEKLDMYYTQISDITGLEYFTNLKSFYSLYYTVGSFNQPTLINLEELSLTNSITGNSGLTTINLTNNINLKSVTCSLLNISSINLNNLVHLKSLSLLGNFTQIDISGCTNLLDLRLNAPITTINLNSNIKLISLLVDNCNIQNLDLSNCTNLEIVYASNNGLQNLNLGTIKHIKYLNVSNNLLTNLNLNNLFNLDVIDCTNNALINLYIQNKVIEQQLSIGNNPNLATICCDLNEIIYVENQCNLNGYSTSISYCEPATVASKPISMYPNPVKDMLHLDADEKINKVEVFGSNGLLIMSNENVDKTVDMQTLQNGLYFLKIYRENEINEMKFIKG